MWTHVAAVLGLSVLCGLWVVFQRWLARKDPGLPGIEDGCGSCHRTECDERVPGGRPASPSPRA